MKQENILHEDQNNAHDTRTIIIYVMRDNNPNIQSEYSLKINGFN